MELRRLCIYFTCEKYEILRNVTKGKYTIAAEMRDTALLEEISSDVLVAGRIKREITMMMITVYSQDVKKNYEVEVEWRGIYRFTLMWSHITSRFVWNSLCSEASSFISADILHRCTEPIAFPNPVPYTNTFILLRFFSVKLIFHSMGKRHLCGHSTHYSLDAVLYRRPVNLPKRENKLNV
jgi:hypothetical protein